jgi:uncharacterized protein (DUF952 family)
MPLIYHITTQPEWAKAKEQGYYEAPSLHTEGFIHCSEEGQVKGVIERYYKGKTDLLKLVIDTNKLTAPLKYELAPSVGQEFPHVYGAINLEAVAVVVRVHSS